MYFTNDYIMRMIEIAIHGLANLVFQKDRDLVTVDDEEVARVSGGVLSHLIRYMVDRGDINGAENLLFEELERNPLDTHLNTAIDFYREISALNDDELLSRGFTREEVLTGLIDVGTLYGMDLTKYLY